MSDTPRPVRFERTSLYVAAFLLGAIVMGFEMLATRYLNPFFGSSIYTWGSLIAVVLGGMTLGYFAGGKLADKYPSPRTLALFIAPAPALLALLPLVGEPVALFIAQGTTDIRLGVLSASLVLFFLPVVMLSAASPFAIRLLLHSKLEGGTISGEVIAISTAGSIVGTLGTVFYLIPTFGTKTITYGFAVLTAFAILVIFAPRLLRMTVPVLLALAFAWPQAAQAATLEELRRNLIDEMETPYNQIYVFKEGNLVTLKFGIYERRFTESRSDVTNRKVLPLPYTQAMTMGVACAPKYDRMLMIGLGGGTTTRYLSEFMPQTEFTTVEIDPGVIQMAEKHFDVQETPQNRIVEQDGRHYLNGDVGQFDTIFVDAYRGWFVPFHLTTKEFYALAKSRLAPGGCLVQNVDPGTLLYDAVMATMSATFENVETMRARGNVIVIGYDGPKRDAAAWRAAAAAAQTRFGFTHDLNGIADWFEEVPWDRNTAALTDDYAPAEMLNMEERPLLPQE